MKKNVRISAVDLFCGAGGLTHGLRSAGVDVAAGIDIDPVCKFPYETNNKAPFLRRDITTVKVRELKALFAPGSIRLLAGCAPCQPFSSHSRGRDTSEDPKWALLDEFSRLVKGVRPELVTMENVVRVRNHSVFQDFVATLEGLGYSVSVQSVLCAAYGVPQERRRLVLLASKLGQIDLLPSTHAKHEHTTVRDVLWPLPALSAGDTDADDPLHKARKLTPINLARMRHSVPGGTWKDWPDELRSACHTKESGSTFRSVYARMSWDRPAPTITTQSFNFGTGRFGHPEQDRTITLREAAILQSFPAKYKFTEKGQEVNFSSIGRLIGNAVPPKLGQIIGKSFLEHCRDHLK
ncbi:DNA cytosine methyltransferase [Paraburkholderia tropica]|uniref:DNA cytosine methyltransferase n=1 Tax=Paraburkholderia tropica TaxID=92647 RepID=UPI002AB1D283|nr:DNA cytosine methyltransferase [Paraburkholderia tropica]